MNRKLPSRGRDYQGRPPLVVYPEAKTPRRLYVPDQELALFSLPRVYQYLAAQHWWRRVSQVGQISLGGQRYGLGITYAGQDIKVTFDAQTTQFLIQDAQHQLIKYLPPKNLTASAITGLATA